jgi:hypothetical protein
MSGVDLMDQKPKYYSIDRKTQKWTIKLCFHVLNIAFYNVFVRHKKFGNSKQTYLQYFIAIMKKLRNINPNDNSFLSNSVIVENPIPVDSKNIIHYAIKLPHRLKCRYCSTTA